MVVVVGSIKWIRKPVLQVQVQGVRAEQRGRHGRAAMGWRPGPCPATGAMCVPLAARGGPPFRARGRAPTFRARGRGEHLLD